MNSAFWDNSAAKEMDMATCNTPKHPLFFTECRTNISVTGRHAKTLLEEKLHSWVIFQLTMATQKTVTKM